jgi:hypothetical protein
MKLKKAIMFFNSFKGTLIEKGTKKEADRLQRIYEKKVKKSYHAPKR